MTFGSGMRWFAAGLLACACAAGAGEEEHPTGMLKSTPEQLAWMLQHFPLATTVRPNATALNRLNAERQAKGKPALSAADVGLAPMGLEAQTGGGAVSRATTGGSGGALPAGVDNSTMAAFPPIGSQAGNSCVGWASTYYLLTHETALARGWDAKSSSSNRLSPKWTYNMINFGVDGGSYFNDAFNMITKHGAARWSEFPQDGNYLAWCLDPAVWRKAAAIRFMTKTSLYNSNTDTMIDLIKQQVANGHVVFIGTFVNSWERRTVPNDPATADDDAFVGQSICRYMTNTQAGGHAMTVVGYQDSIWCDVNLNGVVDAGEKGAFKVANSWGTGDWNAGFRWVAFDALRPTSAVSGGPTNRQAIFSSNGYPTSITVMSSYTPAVLAEFTVNHAKRNQLRVKLGQDATSKTVPAYQWYAGAMQLQGGAYAFNGTATAVDGTFVFDFSDLNAPVGSVKRYFLSVYDSTTGDAATVTSFRLLDSAGNVLATSANTPKSADGGQEAWVWVDYGSGNYPPSIDSAPWANPNSITLGNTTTVNVIASDPDNGPSALTYTWSKVSGPGTVGFSPNGSTVAASSTASLSAAGTYVVRVTVSDGADTVSGDTDVVVVDPNVVNAPSNLTGSASGTTVTLRWTDNSSNETGFQIDRGVKVKNKVTWSSNVATVGANATSFSQTVSNGTYVYRVRAFNSTTGKVSPNSNEVQVKVGTTGGTGKSR
ncbi:MAG: hypothetical protein L6R28_07735 [Planctomycetes bacterium]|nr:hypothetical protein [Planctomycetota bacterium]